MSVGGENGLYGQLVGVEDLHGIVDSVNIFRLSGLEFQSNCVGLAVAGDWWQ